jgi:ribosomal protein L13
MDERFTCVIQVTQETRTLTAKVLQAKTPTLVEKAVKGMLPKNKLGAELSEI